MAKNKSGVNAFHWEDPPSHKRPGKPTPSLSEVLATELGMLETRPGTWARLRKYAKPASASRCATTLKQQVGDRGFEFVTRAVDGAHFVYGRHTAPVAAVPANMDEYAA